MNDLPQSAPGSRIPPLPLADCDENQIAILRSTSGTGEIADSPWYRTLIRHPELHRAWLRFGAELLVRGTLPDRDRELAVLRTAWHCQAAYYFGEHVDWAHRHGITADEVARVVAGPTEIGWAEHDRAVLQATDDLLTTSVIGDVAWSVLATTYNDQQLIELPFLVGHYQMVGYAQRSFGIEPAPGRPGLDAR